MKQAQNARKGRSRSNSPKRGRGGLEGNRAELKVRGNPKQLLEKYKNQAREAMQSGDRIQAESFHQIADHYQRIINEMRGLTRGLFSGNYELVERSEEPDVEVADETAPQHQPQHQPRRGRRGRPGGMPNGADEKRMDHEGNGAVADGAEKAQDSAPDPGVGEQPTEIHPELDAAMQNTPAVPKEVDGEAETEAKPRRTRRPRRPRVTKKATDEAASVDQNAATTEAPTPDSSGAGEAA